MRGRMRTGAEAGIRPGKWSVIMDCFCFALALMRRLFVHFALRSLHSRDAIENDRADGLGPGDLIGIAGTGRCGSDVAGPPVSSVGASETEANCVGCTSFVGGGGSGESVSVRVPRFCGLGVVLSGWEGARAVSSLGRFTAAAMLLRT